MAETWYQTFRTNGTFTFTSPGGKFRLHVIGKGSDGAAGRPGPAGSGGYGGGSGGYAVHEMFIPAGDTAAITINTSFTKIVYQSDTVIAYAGYNQDPGSASGGNVSNVSGNRGDNGASGYRPPNTIGGDSGGRGGNGGKSAGRYQANGGSGGYGGSNDGYGGPGTSPVNTDTSIGGAGGGGGGGSRSSGGGGGGKGANGGIVIELINSAPLAPGWIDLPDGILGGNTITIRWGEASDPDGNLAGYCLERSVDGGSWEERYRGAGRELSDQITMGWRTVQYRVKAYDSSNAESGYILSTLRNVINNRPPSAPASIFVPEPVQGGSGITVSWGAASDPDGNLAGYTLEQSVNSGAWSELFSGSALTHDVPITFGWQTVQFRVRAYDTYGSVGEYTSTGTLSVINNRPPAISGEDRDLGTLVEAFPPQPYIVTDEDGDAVTVETLLDGISKGVFIATLGAENHLEIAPEEWRKLLNGPHTWTIKAADPRGAAATRTISFTKNVTQVRFTLAEPLPADAAPEKMVLSFQGTHPDGSILTIEACNNGFDEAPAWEDVTNQVLTGQKHFFRNTTKTAERWGIGIRVTLDRSSAVGDCYVHSQRGNYA